MIFPALNTSTKKWEMLPPHFSLFSGNKRGPHPLSLCTEKCTGSSAECPANALKAVSTVCRANPTFCDEAEVCDGVTSACPADVPKPDETPCDDGLSYTRGDRCVGGYCLGAGVPPPSSFVMVPD